MDKLIEVSDALLEKETLNRDDFVSIMEGKEISHDEKYEHLEKIEEKDLSEEAKKIVEDKNKKEK